MGGIPLLSTHPELQNTIGWLFNWKLSLLIITIVGSIVVYRFFCKLICPLGAIYGLLNKVSFYRLTVDESKCVHCGKCARVCKMDVDPVKNPQSIECIRCGACAAACPTKAIRIGFGIFRKKAESKPQQTSGCGGNCASCKNCSNS
jgi:polyferredoxin